MTRIARVRTTVAGWTVAVSSVFACADPAGPLATVKDPGPEGPLATVVWEATARELVASHPTSFSPNNASRAYALLAMAQYGALVAADRGGGRAQREARRGAVGGAAVQILSYLVPDAAAALEQQLAAAGMEGTGNTHPSFTSGVATGRAMGEVMRTWAMNDGFSQVWDRQPLRQGPGLWVPAPNVSPAGFQFPAMRPYFLERPSQFRAPAPPAFGSAAFAAGLAAVRSASDARGQREIDIANLWNLERGTQTTLGYWIGRTADLVAAHDLDEREAAHLFAVLNAAAMDASIGCFETKYHYLVLRPSQGDPLISWPVGYGQPNHPSYPANHSCVSAAAVTVLAARFPTAAAVLAAELREVGVSRVYGGIHYPFDVAAGEQLGQAVARWALAYDRDRGVLAAVRNLASTASR